MAGKNPTPAAAAKVSSGATPVLPSRAIQPNYFEKSPHRSTALRKRR